MRIEAALGGALDEPPHVFDVRLVAPNKRMLCVTFRLPASVAFAEAAASEAATDDLSLSAPETKRRKTTNAE